MRGIVFLGNRKLELQDFADPTPGPGEVVLEMKASGMCGSDLHPYRASRSGGAARSLGLGGAGGPCIAGHEPCGVVIERGPGVLEADAPSDARVMNHHYKGCGHCKHCRAGWAQLCPGGIVVYGMTGHGGHAPYMCVPASTLVPLPDELSFEEGASAAKSLKSALEGGVSGPPENVLFVATSNRRHLMPRTHDEAKGLLATAEEAEETISASDRFGLWIGFPPMDQNAYLEAVRGYAAKFALETPDLERRALQWSQLRGGRSGRVAWQFVRELAAEKGVSLPL